jgi:enamine deaminase RidA (YjgF/YER057c/UK114 family)
VDDTEDSSFFGQLENVFQTLHARLSHIGLEPRDLVMVTVWLSNIQEQFDDFNGFWFRYFEPELGPPRSTCEVTLSRPSLLVELSAVAARQTGAG